jgi:iron-sulfur cluster assembly protein
MSSLSGLQSSLRSLKSPVIISEAARDNICKMVDNRAKKSAGVRLSVKTKGCSGLSYHMEFSDVIPIADIKVECGTTFLFIEPKALLFLTGTEIDYKTSDLESGFVFQNPNEKGRCGCGESFHV